jgi:hypothetical protein
MGPLPVNSPARSRTVATFKGASDRDEAPIDRQQVGLGHRPRVGHRYPEQDLALALGVANGSATRLQLCAPHLTTELGTPVEQTNDLPIDRVDPPSKPAHVGRLDLVVPL